MTWRIEDGWLVVETDAAPAAYTRVSRIDGVYVERDGVLGPLVRIVAPDWFPWVYRGDDAAAEARRLWEAIRDAERKQGDDGWRMWGKRLDEFDDEDRARLRRRMEQLQREYDAASPPEGPQEAPGGTLQRQQGVSGTSSAQLGKTLTGDARRVCGMCRGTGVKRNQQFMAMTCSDCDGDGWV